MNFYMCYIFGDVRGPLSISIVSLKFILNSDFATSIII